MTFEEICEVIGCNPNEVVICDDGMILTFGNVDDEREEEE